MTVTACQCEEVADHARGSLPEQEEAKKGGDDVGGKTWDRFDHCVSRSTSCMCESLRVCLCSSALFKVPFQCVPSHNACIVVQQ